MKTKKKGKFLTFCFSMMPGAAQMYMGFMKMGVSLMLLFFLIIILAMWLNQGAIAACCVIVWFYSFFQANHLAGLGDEDFDAVDDRFLFGMESLPGMERFVKEHNKWIAVLLIFAGGCLLWDSMASLMYYALPEQLSFISRAMRRIGDYVPSLVIGCGIIFLGVRMLEGKKQEPWQNEENISADQDREIWKGEVVPSNQMTQEKDDRQEEK